jgi:hypothetical protein
MVTQDSGTEAVMVTRFAEDEAERPFPADHHTLRGSSPDRRDRLGRSPNICRGDGADGGRTVYGSHRPMVPTRPLQGQAPGRSAEDQRDGDHQDYLPTGCQTKWRQFASLPCRDFGRFREACPRRSRSQRNCCWRADGGRSEVVACA